MDNEMGPNRTMPKGLNAEQQRRWIQEEKARRELRDQTKKFDKSLKEVTKVTEPSPYQTQNQGSMTPGANPQDPLLLMTGIYAPGSTMYQEMLRRGHAPGAGSVTSSQAMGAYYNWDDKTKNRFTTELALAGYNVDAMKDGDIAQIWGAYVTQAASYYAQGNALTPWDLLSKDIKRREAVALKPRTVTQTSTQLDLSTRQDAKAIFLTAAQQLLGRDPTKAEVATFQKALNAYERANPRISTTTSKYVGGDMTSQSSTTTGGVSEAGRTMIAMEDIKEDPEYGSYQAATTYFDAMMEMIGGG